MPTEISVFQIIPIGSKNGLMAFNNMCKLKPDAEKMKDEMEQGTMTALRNDAEALK